MLKWGNNISKSQSKKKSKILNNYRPYIIVDEREPKSIKEILKNIGCDIITQTLDVADYILSENLAVERKRGDDFVHSLCDTRLFEQLLRLKETFESPILILEDFGKMFTRPKMKIDSLYGALVFIGIKLGYSIIPTRNIEETAQCLKRIAIREQIKEGTIVLARHAPKSMNNEERKRFILEGLYDTGLKLAKILIEKFRTPLNVFKAINQSRLIYTKTGNPKGVEGPLGEIKGIGFKWIEKNKKLLESSL